MLRFAADPAPAHARGVFETVLVVGGRPVHWERHRERLRASARALYGEEPSGGWTRRAERAAAPHALGRLRVVATPRPGAAPVAAVRATPLDPALVLAAAESELVSVGVPRGYGPHKLVDRDWLERIEASIAQTARPLLVSPAGTLLETTRANVILVRSGALATPPLDGSILPGVTRAVVLELARRAGLALREAPVTLEDLRRADAVLLTGSLRLIERCRVRPGGAGEELARELSAALAAEVGVRR